LFLSKGEIIASINYTKNQHKLNYYTKKLIELNKTQQKKLAYIFCKAVSRKRIEVIKRFNEKRNNLLLKERLKEMRLQEKKLIKVKSIEELKSIEGNIAKHYYVCFKELLPKEIGFESRNRDNQDVFNAVINAIHSLLRTTINQKLTIKSINTSFGFLHYQKDHNKPFLVWDFSEFWLPYTDKLAFYLVNKQIIKSNQLIKAQNNHGKWLNKKAWHSIHKIFEERISEKIIDSKIQEFIDFIEKKKNRFSWSI